MISLNACDFWSKEIITNFKNKNLWNWYCLSTHRDLPWDLELIEQHKVKWDWKILSDNVGLYKGLCREFTETILGELIEYHIDYFKVNM